MSLPQDILLASVSEALTELDLAESMSHSGESGRAREETIRRFIRRFIPDTFAVDTGFVIDVHGNVSRQIDIVVYRSDYAPVLEVGGVKHFFVESVAAVLENKAQVGSRDALVTALENIKSVKMLDRTGGGHAYQVADFHVRGETIDRANPQHQVWGAIISQRSLARDTFMDAIVEWLSANSIHEWPNLYVDVHLFAMYYLGPSGGGQLTVMHWPHSADRFGLTNPKEGIGEPPLVDLAVLLAERLRTAAPIDYRPSRYFSSSRGVDGGRLLPSGA